MGSKSPRAVASKSSSALGELQCDKSEEMEYDLGPDMDLKPGDLVSQDKDQHRKTCMMPFQRMSKYG